jgi:hypothetical protein
MECLRLHSETNVTLKALEFMIPSDKPETKKSKAKKLTEFELYQQLVIDYIDRICIWNAFENTNVYKDFVEPILVN